MKRALYALRLAQLVGYEARYAAWRAYLFSPAHPLMVAPMAGPLTQARRCKLRIMTWGRP